MFYICIDNYTNMFNLIGNTISCIGTFLVISSTVVLLSKLIIYAITRKYDSKHTDSRVVVLGIVIGLILTPFYYLPY